MTYQKINLFHVMVVGPLLTYIGFKGKETPPLIFGTLLGLTLIIEFMVRTPGFKLNYRNSISWVHWLVWSSLFVWISYKQSELPDYMFEIIKYLGISTVLIHLYILYQYYK